MHDSHSGPANCWSDHHGSGGSAKGNLTIAVFVVLPDMDLATMDLMGQSNMDLAAGNQTAVDQTAVNHVVVDDI